MVVKSMNYIKVKHCVIEDINIYHTLIQIKCNKSSNT